ncbi:MAG: GTPase ObgE [Actinomycetota bacterium]
MSERGFVDETRLHVAAGSGGDGAMSFLREKFKPKGRPNGGDGGRGGSIILKVDPGLNTLAHLARSPHVKAARGGNGQSSDKFGADAKDVVLAVPDGTEVRSDQGELMADLVGAGTEFVVARGGRGGRGNATLANSRRRAPGFREKGEPGEEAWIRLSLKVLADIGLVGLPNAGKSSLLRAISAARPEVAAYPFTTLTPQLGVIPDLSSRVVVADVPGLIEGAAEGRGLGHAFLKHLERCPVLVMVLDAADETMSADETYQRLSAELEAYDPALRRRMNIAAINKTDIATAEQVAAAQESARARGFQTFAISARDGTGVDSLLEACVSAVQVERSKTTPKDRRLVRIRPESTVVEVVREDQAWRVRCEAAERLLARYDLNEPDALAFVQDRLVALGVERALIRAGAGEGDEVVLGDLVFAFSPDAPEDDDD